MPKPADTRRSLFPTLARLRGISRETRERIAVVVIFVAVGATFTDLFTTLVIGLMSWLAYRLLYRRDMKVVALIISSVAAMAMFDCVGARVVRWQLSLTHTPDVDHRMVPFAYPWINSDGIRSDFEASDFSDESFNVICMGDSFCFGALIDDTAETYVALLESMTREKYPEKKLRTVNFGWVSSSPIITLPHLKDFGGKYKPDLVIYSLDMTDFHDDLRRRYGAQNIGTPPGDYLIHQLGGAHLVEQFRKRWWLGQKVTDYLGRNEIIPQDRFFIVNQPLARSRALMAETESNLLAIHDYCRDVLKCPFILIMPPRHFQYTDRECLNNWEALRYQPLGPYVKMPFLWLEEVKARAPYSIYSLFDDFKNATEFPLYFDDDPHWTPAGHRVVARALMRILEQEGYLRSTSAENN